MNDLVFMPVSDHRQVDGLLKVLSGPQYIPGYESFYYPDPVKNPPGVNAQRPGKRRSLFLEPHLGQHV